MQCILCNKWINTSGLKYIKYRCMQDNSISININSEYISFIINQIYCKKCFNIMSFNSKNNDFNDEKIKLYYDLYNSIIKYTLSFYHNTYHVQCYNKYVCELMINEIKKLNVIINKNNPELDNLKELILNEIKIIKYKVNKLKLSPGIMYPIMENSDEINVYYMYDEESIVINELIKDGFIILSDIPGEQELEYYVYTKENMEYQNKYIKFIIDQL